MRRSYPVGHLEDWGNVRALLAEIIAGEGTFPTYQVLQRLGHSVLAVAIVDHHGGMQAVRKKMGESPNRVPHEHWLAWENVEAALRKLAADLGRVPTHKDMRARHLGRLSTTIHKVHGGTEAVHLRMGYASHERPKGYWNSRANVIDGLRSLEASLGRAPTPADLRSPGLGGLAVAIRRHGGWNAVSAELGYGPVTDETIAAHADALATIVPVLGANPSVLWSRMKRTWTIRDLDAAVAEHSTNGSLERFRLLGG